MQFESLPNEIFLQCFDYLNAPDVFHAFKQLNNRFDRLLQSSSLCLNFQHVRKATFDHFCRILLLNPEVKQQILSITLSNQSDTCCQIQAFLSFFSLAEFVRLQSLSLIEVKENEVSKLQPMLSSLFNLRYFHLIGTSEVANKLVNSLPVLHMRQLIVSNLCAHLVSMHQINFLTHLTIISCHSLNNLFELFRAAPNLQCLSIDQFSDDSDNEYTDSSLSNSVLVSLTTLSLSTDLATFDQLALVLKHTPSLERFTLCSTTSQQFIDARRWECLIQASLPHLKTFKFHFLVLFEEREGLPWAVMEVFDKFQEFQTDFWHKQHHWHTAFEFDKDFAILYTIPYMLHSRKLTMYTNRFSDTVRQNSNLFDTVLQLELTRGTLRKGFQHRFVNIQSLKLTEAFYSDGMFDTFLRDNQDIESLNLLVNLSNLQHLDIGTTCRTESSLLLCKILKQTPQLSSLRIDASALLSSLNDDELCVRFRKMIKKLDVVKNNDHLNISSYHLESLCKMFSDIEQLRFPIQRADDLCLLLNQLPKLSSLTVKCLFFPCEITSWLHDISSKLKTNFLFEFVQHDYDVLRPTINLWIGERINCLSY